ncbi:MAG TPA: HDOD domain-containing protein [Syntrophorhabdaceae bacterium]|nr:HDOD domain-containing protein [Syntrophorhabdaceae bacterium]
MVNEKIIVERLKNIDLLPTFPHIVHDVLRVIEDPMSSASDIAKHMDASMVGEVLHLANSAFYNRSGIRKITSIEQAIAIIGYEHLAHIILQMPFLVLTKKEDRFMDVSGFITHSSLCGMFSKNISLTTLLGNPNDTFIAGLIHDVGTIIIYKYFYEEWKEIYFLVHERNKLRLEAERDVLSVDHGVIAAMLLDLWDIPKSISNPIRFHHNPEEAKEDVENVAAVYIGNILAKQINFNLIQDGLANFMTSNMNIVKEIERFRHPLSSNEEVELFKRVFDALKEFKRIFRGPEDDREYDE